LVHELSKESISLVPPNDKVLSEEICRTCLIKPEVERVSFLPVRSVLVENRLIEQVERVFDITTSSGQRGALYSIEELRKIPELGYGLRNGCLVHPHGQSFNPTASIADIVAFLTTDAALGVSLNYLVVSATKDTLHIKRFNFKHCFDCAHFGGVLKDAPLVDTRIDQEAK
jgi:hypothetical protein